MRFVTEILSNDCYQENTLRQGAPTVISFLLLNQLEIAI